MAHILSILRPHLHMISFAINVSYVSEIHSWLSFHYPFLNLILSAVLCDLWKTIELLSTPLRQIPSLISWRSCLEKWTAYGARNWEGGMARGLLRWNQAGTREEVENNKNVSISDSPRDLC